MKNIRIGMVCPYGWDTPGGVQTHIRDLAEHLIEEGHFVSAHARICRPETREAFFASKATFIPHVSIFAQARSAADLLAV